MLLGAASGSTIYRPASGIFERAPPHPTRSVRYVWARVPRTHRRTPNGSEDRVFLLARIVRLVTMIVVAFIVAGIVLHLLDANSGNAVVSFVYDVAGWLVTPFKSVFSVKGTHAHIAANWGLAAVVYAIVGGLLSRLLARAGAVSFGGRRRMVAR